MQTQNRHKRRTALWCVQGGQNKSADFTRTHLSSFIISVHRRITIDSWVAQLEQHVPHVAGQRVHASLHVRRCSSADAKHRGSFTHEADCQRMMDENTLYGVLQWRPRTPLFHSGVSYLIHYRGDAFRSLSLHSNLNSNLPCHALIGPQKQTRVLLQIQIFLQEAFSQIPPQITQ